MIATSITFENHFNNEWQSYDGTKSEQEWLALQATKEMFNTPVAEALKGVPYPEYEAQLEFIDKEREIQVIFILPNESTWDDIYKVYDNHNYMRAWAYSSGRTAVTLGREVPTVKLK